MDMIPVPQEQEIMKICKLKVMRTRILEKAKTNDDKNLIKAAEKLNRYIDNPGELTPAELDGLTTDLHRSILIIQKQKKRGIN